MKTIPGIGIRGVEPSVVVRCQCGAELRRLAPGEELINASNGAATRTRMEEVECAGCTKRARLEIGVRGTASTPG